LYFFHLRTSGGGDEKMDKKVLIFTLMLLVLLASFSATSYLPQVAATYIGPTETATLYSIADSYVNASSPDTNYGNDQDLIVNASSTDLSQNFIYVKFDLSSIPQNAYIVSTSLELRLSGFDNLYYGIMGGGDAIGAYYCSDNSWAELGITWNNRPTFNDTPTGSSGFGMFIYYAYRSWDVTGDLKKSLPLGALTEVLKFSSKNDGYGYAEFQSKEATNKPKLEIQYTTTPVFGIQFESAQDPEATPYISTVESNLGFISFADQTVLLPESFDVAQGSYPIEYDSGYNFVRWETTGGITVSNNNAKSTTATISGSGTLKAIGNAETLEYYRDSGIPYPDYSLPTGQIYAKTFTPVLSGQLLSVRYYMNNVSSTTQKSFRVHILDANKERLITPFEATPTSNGWFNVDLTTRNINVTEETDFYVAFEFLDNDLCLSESTITDYSYSNYVWDGTEWTSSYDQPMIRATVLNNITPETDDTPPEIGIPFQNPPSYDVKDGEQVTVSVSVIDIESGVKNATLFYNINNGDYWENRPLNYNPPTVQYEATIPGQEEGTNVKFRIEAYNNAGLKATRDETEPYSTYQVIPEFSIFGIVLLSIVATLTIIIYRKKYRSHGLINQVACAMRPTLLW
jgi:hypothetical protein